MNLKEAMKERHSVRQYKSQSLSTEAVSAMQAEIDVCNHESGLHIQLVTDEPKAFDGFMAHYGKFKGVRNYIALIGKKDSELDEKCGYYGERLVLKAQQLGLNTCWVAMTYSKVKSAFSIGSGEKLCVVIAIGYGETQGVPHKSKFMFTLDGNKVTAKAGKGFYTKLDLGIVKYHFEIGAGKDVFQWG